MSASGVATIVLASCLIVSSVGGQSPQPRPPGPIGFPFNRPSPDLLYSAARLPELTYTNSSYGLSFRFPSNFVLHLGEYERGVYSPSYDPAETLIVNLEIPSEFWMGTNVAVPMLFVGVNPKLSSESCIELVAPDGSSSGAPFKVTIDGIQVVGRNQTRQGTGRGMQFGTQAIYQRQYAGYRNGVCYEFEIDMAIQDFSRISRSPFGPVPAVDLDRIFAELEAIVLTAKFAEPDLSPAGDKAKNGRVTKPWETSLQFPKELAATGALADWQIQYPPGVSRRFFPLMNSGSVDSEDSFSIKFEYDSSLDRAAASAEIDGLAAKVVQLVQKNGWKLSSAGVHRGFEHYVKGPASVDVMGWNSRCTMNSPCTGRDSLAVTVYVPVRSTD